MSVKYSVKEIYYTLQGEGIHSGRAAVFCRFAGCNLWNGREADRTTAQCWFCDTDFVGTDGPNGGVFTSERALKDALFAQWPSNDRPVFIVFTGGEPLLQLRPELIRELKKDACELAVETNGTRRAPEGLDWITVSPKPNAPLAQLTGNELKLVYPHQVQPQSVAGLDFTHFLLSPLQTSDPVQNKQHLQAAIEYCRHHPQWRLTMQYHKLWQIP